MKTSLRVLCSIAGATTLSLAHSANLVPNPDFDDGLDGWSMVGTSGVMTLDGNIGFPALPSLHLSSDTLNPTLGTAALSQCIPADDSTRYDFFFNAIGGGVWGGVDAFSDGDCATPLGSVNTEAFRSAGGTYALTDFLLPDGTQSARVMLASIPAPLGSGEGTIFDHVLFGPTGTLYAPISIQQGLSGAWYNPQTSGQGLEFTVGPDQGIPTDITVFGAWYTYDTMAGGPDTQRWYSFQTTPLEQGIKSAPVVIYQIVGGNFDAPPTTSAAVVGTGTLSFDTCSTGSFVYQFDDGRSGTMPLLRLQPNVTCAENSMPTDPPSDFGLSGSWFNPDTSGQGLLVNIDPVNAQVFVGWFSYALNGQGQGASGQRWFSAQGGYTVGSTSMNLTLYASTGGTFDSDDTTVTTLPVGTATLTYASCTAATFDYAFTSGELSGKSGTIALARLGAPLTSCNLPD